MMVVSYYVARIMLLVLCCSYPKATAASNIPTTFALMSKSMAAEDESTTLIRLIRDTILSITRQIDGRAVDEDTADFLAFRLEQLYDHILRPTAPLRLQEIEPFVCEAARLLRAFQVLGNREAYGVEREVGQGVGRPRFSVERSQLEYPLHSLHSRRSRSFQAKFDPRIRLGRVQIFRRGGGGGAGGNACPQTLFFLETP